MIKLQINGHFLHQSMTGVQRYAIEILKGFDRGGFPYHIIEPSSLVSSNKLTQHFWEQLVLPRRKTSEDILWSPTNTGPVFASNHIITLHDMGVFPHPEWFSPGYVRWKRKLIPAIAERAKGILTVSNFSRKIIASYLDISTDKIKVVYNGVDTSKFRPCSRSQIEKAREKYSIKAPYFMALGSLDPRKNFKRLIDAWNQCVEEEHLTGYELVIGGASNANFRRLKVDEMSSKVHFLGYVQDEDLAPIYAGATAFLFPSLFEGFGLPVIEAMACGTPVLTSSTTALDEIVGDSALKVNPAKASSIKEGIMELASSSSLRENLAALGLERTKLFNWDQSAEAIYQYLTG